MNNEILVVEEIYKSFELTKHEKKQKKIKDKRKIAVRNLSFHVLEGEIYGLLGPNGAGKTTTLRILSTLIKPDRGNVLIKGISVIDDPDLVRRNIGFLTSELKLDGFLTPNYLFDFFSSLYQLEKEQSLQRKNLLFQKFGIDEFADVKVCNLSSGMKQKISLVISIVHDPQIIIFDEPTNGLDIITAKVVTDFLIEMKKMGKTIILSTHIFDLVEKLCDRVGIIIQGNMVYNNSVSEIMKEMSLEQKFFQLYQELGEQRYDESITFHC